MERHDKNFIKGILVGAAAVFLIWAGAPVAARGISLLMGRYFPSHSAGIDRAVRKKLDLLKGVIDERYLYSDEVDADALKEGMYKGYMSALGDPYSIYYDEKETEALFESTSGEYSGIGAVLSQDLKTGIVVVNSVYKDSPAQKGGLKDGDRIYQVDSHVISGEDLSEIVTWIRGAKGTEVVLHVFRGESAKNEECRIIRDVIEARTVAYEMLEDKVGYLQITEFNDMTFGQFKEALRHLKNEGMKALVVDLRSNPGGGLQTTVDILKLILPKGIIVYTQDKDGRREEYRNDEDHRFTEPMAVLVDEYTASAAEIFSGAVKDYGVGTIVGTTTFGKGIVQQILDLGDGTALKLTVSEYFTPSGKNIHGKGIEPDVAVELPDDISKADSDVCLDRAVEIVKEKLR